MDSPNQKFTKPKISNSETTNTFHQLVAQWKQDIMCIGSTTEITSNINYQKIIDLAKGGEEQKKLVTTLILKELAASPGHWFAALRIINNNGPIIPTEDLGKISKMSGHWLNWGVVMGYCQLDSDQNFIFSRSGIDQSHQQPGKSAGQTH